MRVEFGLEKYFYESFLEIHREKSFGQTWSILYIRWCGMSCRKYDWPFSSSSREEILYITMILNELLGVIFSSQSKRF